MSGQAKNIFIALTNPAAGKEDEYNRFYDDIHVGDVISAPGWVACQRYKLADEQRSDQEPPFKYIAIYELDLPDGEILEALKHRPDLGPEGKPDPPLWDDSTQVWIFTPWGERQVSDGRDT